MILALPADVRCYEVYTVLDSTLPVEKIVRNQTQDTSKKVILFATRDIVNTC